MFSFWTTRLFFLSAGVFLALCVVHFFGSSLIPSPSTTTFLTSLGREDIHRILPSTAPPPSKLSRPVCGLYTQPTLRKEWKYVYCSFEPVCLSSNPDEGLLIFEESFGLSRMDVANELSLQDIKEGKTSTPLAAGEGLNQFRRDIHFANETFKQFSARTSILWISGTSVAASKGVNWKSFAHRLQPYFDAVKTWEHYLDQDEDEEIISEMYGDTNQTDDRLPQLVIFLREDVDTLAPLDFARPLLARRQRAHPLSMIVNATVATERRPPFCSSSKGTNLTPPPAGVDYCVPPSEQETYFVSAEEVQRLQKILRPWEGPHATAVCMERVVYSEPASGSQYAPLYLTKADMKKVHRRFAEDLGSSELRTLYSKDFMANDINAPCLITFVNRRGKNRRVQNSEELSTAIQSLISRNSFTGKDAKILKYSETWWEDKSFAEQVHDAARACILITPHGAGLINAMHMRPNSLLIELNPARYYWPRLRISVEQMGVRVSSVWFEENNSTQTHANETVITLSESMERRNQLLLDHAEFYIDPQKVIAHIENYLLKRLEKPVFNSYTVHPPAPANSWLRSRNEQKKFGFPRHVISPVENPSV